MKEGSDCTMLTIEEITNKLKPIFSSKNIEKAVLFGSYVKNKATGESDVDLVIDSDITGMPYMSLLVEVEDVLGCDVDLIPRRSIDINSGIYKNIESEGVLIYEKSEAYR